MPGKQRLGVCVKGNGGGVTVFLLRQRTAGGKKRLMADMHTVEESQCVNSFLLSHNLTKSNYSAGSAR